MAVREALLALLSSGPKHGYQLKHDFEAVTGSAWPLNVGQVYTTLGRLERDGLVEAIDAPDPAGAGTDDHDDDGDGDGTRLPYRLTDVGAGELQRWLATPSAVPLANRDETTMRVLLALATARSTLEALLDNQRRAATETLQALTAMKAEPDPSLPWRLQVDRMIFVAEAELRWLDRTEERLARAASRPADPPGAEAEADPRAIGEIDLERPRGSHR